MARSQTPLRQLESLPTAAVHFAPPDSSFLSTPKQLNPQLLHLPTMFHTQDVVHQRLVLTSHTPFVRPLALTVCRCFSVRIVHAACQPQCTEGRVKEKLA